MMHRLLVLIVAMVVSLQASTIVSHLELVLSDSGTLIDGPTDVTISLIGSTGDVRWREFHSEVPFFKGVASIQIGYLKEIKTHYFFGEGVQLMVSIGSDSISLPMHSTPFSLFSHSANVVNAIHMEGVFHTDLVNKRIGIHLDVPTPSALLEVRGAIRVGDDPDIDVIGAIRWRDFRLDGRHNHQWQPLDIGPHDDLETKWSKWPDTTNFYYLGPVRIMSDDSPAMLTVSGDVYVDELLTVGEALMVGERLNLLDDYGVSINSDVIARSIQLNPNNQFNVDDGLKVSGVLSGRADGLFGIDSQHLAQASIQAHEITANAIMSHHLLSGVITNSKVQPAAISESSLHESFKLTNEYFLNGIITSQKIKPFSIHEDDFSETFELMAFHFMDDVIVSRNVGIGYMDSVKINDDELTVADFRSGVIDSSTVLSDQLISSSIIVDGSILAEDFLPGSLTYDHFGSEFLISNGGTAQTSYGTLDGELLVVSNNQFVSEPTVVLSDAGLGIYDTDPLQRLSIQAQPGTRSLRVQSSNDSSSGIVFKNANGHWFLGAESDTHFDIYSFFQPSSDHLLSMAMDTGHLGVGIAPGVERVTVHGAVLFGDRDTSGTALLPGSVYFSQADGRFKWVTDQGEGSIGLHLGTSDRPSFLFSHHVLNDSHDARVILGDHVALMGNDHMVYGAFSSVVHGRSHDLDGVYLSTIFGDHHQIRQSLNSQFFGQKMHGSFMTNAVVFGSSHHMAHGSDVIVGGRAHTINQVVDSDIQGEEHQVYLSDSVDLRGASTMVNMSTDMVISGNDHWVSFSDHMAVVGDNHMASHVNDSVLDGVNHAVIQSDSVLVSGRSNQVESGHHSVVIGDYNHTIHSSARLIGSHNRHYGSGAPTLIGNHNVVLGHYDGALDATRAMSLGTSKAPIENDGSIHFHAPGGVHIVSGEMPLAVLAPNAGSWSHVSDRSLKVNVQPLNVDEILNKVVALPIQQWRYKGQNYVTHIGPMAQDFYRAFHFGNNERYIQSVDMDGVVFSSIQGLGRLLSTVTQGYHQLSQDESVISDRSRSVVDNVHGLTVSGNYLVDLNESLNHRFADLHAKELSQSTEIEQLSERLSVLKSRLGVSK